MDLGPHAFFIVAAYGATAVIVGGLILSAMLDYRAQRRALSDLEGRGLGRRSSDVSRLSAGETPKGNPGDGPFRVAGP